MKKSFLRTIQNGISVTYNGLVAEADTLMHELKMRTSMGVQAKTGITSS